MSAASHKWIKDGRSKEVLTIMDRGDAIFRYHERNVNTRTSPCDMNWVGLGFGGWNVKINSCVQMVSIPMNFEVDQLTSIPI